MKRKREIFGILGVVALEIVRAKAVSVGTAPRRAMRIMMRDKRKYVPLIIIFLIPFPGSSLPITTALLRDLGKKGRDAP